MVVPRLIERKRNGEALTPDEWRDLLAGYHAGTVPEYQMSALAMAICFRGLAVEELAALLDGMIESGRRLDRSRLTRPLVDKHSTGGVGDKTSLILAPLAAECGLAVPMMSGRGLGHTGGTLDKLESIAGFRTGLSLAEAEVVLYDLGVVMMGQTGEIAPVDKKLYALRDVTGTVESIPLISASIMSKKLAESLDGLVLDVKTGTGAFMPDPAMAGELARTMIALGEARGCRVVALLTAMDRPLGRECGNALEVRESIDLLRNEGPQDLRAVTLALGEEMLLVGGVAATRADARARLEAALASGAALDRFRRLVERQGGDPRVIDDPSLLPTAPFTSVVTSPTAGLITGIDPRVLGRAIVALGGGRTRTDDVVDPAVGMTMHVTSGDVASVGRPLATVHARTEAGLALGRQAVLAAVGLDDGYEPRPLVEARLTRDGEEAWTSVAARG
jgi:pyrimidine-nucleoside phosphorylase